MHIHDWTSVVPGIFHDFHHEWISTIKQALNSGLLPSNHYALAEKTTGAPQRSRIAIRHASDDQIVAAIEIVSPGNKSGRHALRAFVDKAVELLEAGIHLSVVDLFPPGVRDPAGVHGAIWSEIKDDEFRLPAETPLTVVAYAAGESKQAFIEPVAVGQELPPLSLFFTPFEYVPVPLESTYQAAFDSVPKRWRGVLDSASAT